MVEKPEKTEPTYEHTRRRKLFGKELLFEDHGPEIIVNIPCNPSVYKNYVLRNPVHIGIQNTGTMSEHWVNSERVEYTSSGVNHVEGGWPKDINLNDPEAGTRYRRKIEKDDAYIHAVMHLGHSMEHNILQNNAIDMYQTYYTEMPAIPPVEQSTCQTVNVYREPGAKRAVRSLSWQSDGGAKLAAAHADVELMRNNRSPQNSYIWDIDNANAPELIIKPPQPLLDLQYNPRDQHTLVGGMMNGQVGWWDMRKGGEAVSICPPHVAHRDLVRSVLFINSKIGAEFISASPDGVVKCCVVPAYNLHHPNSSRGCRKRRLRDIHWGWAAAPPAEQFYHRTAIPKPHAQDGDYKHYSHESQRSAYQGEACVQQWLNTGGCGCCSKYSVGRWDTRNMSEPTYSMIIDLVKSPTDTANIENSIGISALEYEPTIPTRFMVGTETGLVIGGNRKGKNDMEKLPTKYEAHFGPVYSLKRNPTFLKNFLSVGDWTAKVWSEDCRESSILWTYSHRTKLTDGAWNPVRFSVMLITQWDGCLSSWDLLRRRSGPIVTAQLCDEPLQCLRPHEGGLLVACGSSKGTVYLAELSPNLGTADKNDKQLLTHILERENKRERILEARMREIRLKARQERDVGAQATETDATPSDKDLEEATDEYMQTIKQLQEQQKNTIP